ncbi:MAG: glycosyltransferase family 87 protein [Patescibacteria group bacterium]|jgi:hypothetical protein
MKKWLVIIAVVALALIGLLFFVVPDELDIPGLKQHTVDLKKGLYQQSIKSLWFDYGDIAVYYHRSEWVKTWDFPYSFTNQEYPPLGVLYFSIPRIFTSTEHGYIQAFVGFSAFTYVAFLFIMWKLLAALHRPRWYMIALFLPSFLYFIASRFDIFAATIVMAAVWLLVKKKFVGSMVLLGVAMLIKWYPILLIPFAIAWASQQGISRKEIRKGVIWSASIFFGATGITLIMSGVRAGFPYGFHILRGVEMGSLPSVFLKIVSVFHVPIQSDAFIIVLGLILFGIQLLPLFYGTFLYPRMQHYVVSFDDFLRFSLLAVMIFVHAGKIYSPQWEIWWLPLAALVICKRSELFILIAIDLLNYTIFPLIPVIYNAGWFRYAFFDSIVIVHAVFILVLGMLISKPLFVRHQLQEVQGVRIGTPIIY